MNPRSCFFFGTFNPIHVGHLMMAQMAFNQYATELGFKLVTFVPANQPPHRNEPDLAPAVHRLKMVQLATADNPRFRVSDVEFQRAGASYTVETLAHLEQTGQIDSAQKIPFIIGSDALAHLDSWHEPWRLISRAVFLQVPRPGVPVVETAKINGQVIPIETQMVDMPPMAVSATWLRQQLSQNNYLRYMIPDSVLAYLQNNHLYTG